jgi:hypothetical protein
MARSNRKPRHLEGGAVRLGKRIPKRANSSRKRTKKR